MDNFNIEQITTSNQLLDYIRQEAKDNGNLSIRGTAKLAGIDESTLRKSHLNGAGETLSKLAEKLTQHGFDGAGMTQNGLPPKAVVLVLEYFAYESKVKSEQARKLLMTFSVIGLMETLEQLKPKADIVQPDLSELMMMMQTVIKQNQEQKENMQLLLADKSEKELIGELITASYEGISDLLKGVLGEIARHHGEEINAMYKLRPYYTLKEIALKFFPEDKVETIVNKSRCNINGLYKSITKKLLPQERGNYQYDKINVIFALWRLYHCAKEIGMNVEFIDLENQTYIDSLEGLFDLE